jgi:hypothetical protein
VLESNLKTVVRLIQGRNDLVLLEGLRPARYIEYGKAVLENDLIVLWKRKNLPKPWKIWK